MLKRTITLAALLLLAGCDYHKQPSVPAPAPEMSSAAPAKLAIASPLGWAPQPAGFSFLKPGASAMQVTEAANGAEVLYFDVPAYSKYSGKVYVATLGPPAFIAAMNPDGSGAQQITASPAKAPMVSYDGKLLLYVAASSCAKGDDLFWLDLTKPGAAPMQLTNFCTGYSKLQTGPPVIGPVGTHLIAVAVDSFIHVIQVETGKELAKFDAADKYHGFSYHRIRFNPQGGWIGYKREACATCSAGTPEWFIYNYRTGKLFSIESSTVKMGHPSWSPTGQKLLYHDSDTAKGYIASVLDSNGNPVPDFPTMAVPQPAGKTMDYGVWQEDEKGLIAFSGFKQNGGDVYSIPLDGSPSVDIAHLDALNLTDAGTPLGVLYLDHNHLAVRSDKSGKPQVYLIGGF